MNRIRAQRFLLVPGMMILFAAPLFAQKQTPPAGTMVPKGSSVRVSFEQSS